MSECQECARLRGELELERTDKDERWEEMCDALKSCRRLIEHQQQQLREAEAREMKAEKENYELREALREVKTRCVGCSGNCLTCKWLNGVLEIRDQEE
jgi:chromosome segregation ATPase